MTKAMLLADTQIGVATVTLADQRDVLDRIVQVGLDEKVDFVVHGGDVFEGAVVTPEQVRVFLDATEPLRSRSIPIVVLRGNGRHDSAVRSVHALDVLRDVPGFTVCDRPQTIMVAGCGICVLPWVHPGQLLARMNGSIDHDRVNSAVTDLLVTIASDLYRKLRDEADFEAAMLVAHWAISGARLPSGIAVEEMREPVLPWADLDGIGYDVIVGAHIHEPQMLSRPDIDQGPGFVIGSPQQLNFGERGEHGIWIVETRDDLEPDCKFIPIKSREFITLDFSHDDPLAQFALSEHVGWDIPYGSIVRVRMSLTEQQFQQLDQFEMRVKLIEAGADEVRLDLDVERETRRRVEISEQLSPADAMSLYCEAAGVSEDLREQLIRTIEEWNSE